MGGSVPAYVSGLQPFDYHTETAGTVIDEQIPARNNARLALLDMGYLAAATAHIASFMFAEGTGSRNTTSAAAAAAQKDLVCTDDPKDPAGNAAAASDIIAYQCSDGTWEFNTVASLASKTITLTNNIAKAVAAGAKVCIFGVVGDGKSQKVRLAASVETKVGEGRLCGIVHPYMGEPFYLTIDNGTAAGFLYRLLMGYIDI